MCRQATIVKVLLLALCLMRAATVEADIVKRAPSGFMGMRGKKQDNEELTLEDLEKTAPGMGFQDMRAKQDQDSNMIHDEPAYYNKRAPGMGFLGMRGKKDNDFSLFDEVNKRVPSMGFQGMRGKKDQNLIKDPEYFEKRAPGMGFQGMRGKKDNDVSLYDDFNKRAPGMGFQGMRGKKDQDNSFGTEHDYDNRDVGSLRTSENKDHESDYASEMDDIWGEGFEKRAPSGFFGMRGKKQPTSGFFGMRGKKAPSGFMGMRGKKIPSGFMGMRGKKGGDGVDLNVLLATLEGDDQREQADDAQLRELGRVESLGETISNMRTKRYKAMSNTKKAPSGFMGMRGKKWDAVLDTESPQLADTL